MHTKTNVQKADRKLTKCPFTMPYGRRCELPDCCYNVISAKVCRSCMIYDELSSSGHPVTLEVETTTDDRLNTGRPGGTGRL